MRIPDKYFKIIIVGLLIFLIILLISIRSRVKPVDHTTRWLVQNTDWHKLSKIENAYTCNMYDIFRIWRSPMRKEEIIKYTAINFKLAKKFGYGLYDIPTEHILESQLQPKKIHKLYNELGLGGFWYSTAILYYNTAIALMPGHKRRAVYFELKRPRDLLDSINALKMSYMWRWIEEMNYDGTEMWWASARRWGRFIYQHYDDGDAMYPVKFVIYTRKYGKKKYDPRAIHWTWREMTKLFEQGDLAGALNLSSQYEARRIKMDKEEAEYRRAVSVIKKQKKQINELKKINALRDAYIQRIEAQNNKAIKVMRQIGGEAKKKGWTRKRWDQLKSFLRKTAKELSNARKRLSEIF